MTLPNILTLQSPETLLIPCLEVYSSLHGLCFTVYFFLFTGVVYLFESALDIFKKIKPILFQVWEWIKVPSPLPVLLLQILLPQKWSIWRTLSVTCLSLKEEDLRINLNVCISSFSLVITIGGRERDQILINLKLHLVWLSRFFKIKWPWLIIIIINSSSWEWNSERIFKNLSILGYLLNSIYYWAFLEHVSLSNDPF